jgi:hypothetical protein
MTLLSSIQNLNEQNQAAVKREDPIKESLIDVLGQQVILFDDHVEALIGDNTSHISKKITYEDFSAIIGTVLERRNNETMETFQLPANCFFFGKSSTAIELSCYYAERTATITYIDKKYEVKFPNVIISHTLQKHNSKMWKIISSFYFATDVKVGALPKTSIKAIDHRRRIWLFPFPNTYSEGRMCYGGNSMPTMFPDGNLSGLNWYYQFLFESPFNNDLGLRAVAGDPSITGWLNQLQKAAKNNEPFPYDQLRGYTKPSV